MLYHELYGSYYRAVAEILRLGMAGPVSRADMVRICNEVSFGDSALNVPPALLGREWPLMDGEGRALLDAAPTMPLTLLERRWLRAISLDPRVALFDVDLSFVGDVEPLFRPEDVIEIDRYADGDDYADEGYRAIFRTLLKAVQERRKVQMTYASRRGTRKTDVCVPLRLEYSQKDDCFRVLCAAEKEVATRNVSGVTDCMLLERFEGELPDPERRDARRVTLEITDYRNTLERTSLHFAHLRKEVVRAGEQKYLMTLWYDPTDETEMVIRVLQFGPMVKAVSPRSFVVEVQKRINAQLALLDGGSTEAQEG